MLARMRGTRLSIGSALAIAAALAIAPTALATRAKFGGEVEDAGKAVGHLRLSIRFAHNRPKEVNNTRSSLLPLDCEKGDRGFTANFRRGRHGHAPIGSSGRITLVEWKFGKDGTVRATVKIHVHVDPDRAHGRLHYRSNGSKHGVCKTDGWLRWSAARH